MLLYCTFSVQIITKDLISLELVTTPKKNVKKDIFLQMFVV